MTNKEDSIKIIEDIISRIADDNDYKPDYVLFQVGDIENLLDIIRGLNFKIERLERELEGEIIVNE